MNPPIDVPLQLTRTTQTAVVFGFGCSGQHYVLGYSGQCLLCLNCHSNQPVAGSNLKISLAWHQPLDRLPQQQPKVTNPRNGQYYTQTAMGNIICRLVGNITWVGCSGQYHGLAAVDNITG